MNDKIKSPEVMHHLQMKKGDVGRYVLLPGDPGRSEVIAKYFENQHFVASNRDMLPTPAPCSVRKFQ